MENYKVYAHINKENGKAYIGISKQNLKTRWGKNGKGYSQQPKFYNAIQKYGWDNFIHCVLIENIETQEEALDLETYYIEKYNSIDNGYNILHNGIKSYPRTKPVYCITTKTKYDSIREASLSTGCEASKIIANCKAKIGLTKGLSWTYWDVDNNAPIIKDEFQSKIPANSIKIYCIEKRCFYNSIQEACRELNLDKRSLQRVLNYERAGIQNLHFVKASEMHKIKDVIQKDIGKSKRVYCYETNEIYFSLQEAAKMCNKTPQSVMKNCQGKLKSCNGFHFSYVSQMDINFIMDFYKITEVLEDGDIVLQTERYQGY